MSAAEQEQAHDQVGAYVLHALPAAERSAFENHLAGCAACRQEADASASLLARLAGTPLPEEGAPVTAPQRVRARVLDQAALIARERAGPARVTAPRRARRRAPALALAATVAAAALGGVAAWQRSEATDARQQAARTEGAAREAADRLTSVLTASDAAVHTARLPDGASVGIVVAASENRAAFTAQSLPALSGGRVYELWYAAGTEQLRPAGLVSGRGGAAIRLMEGWIGDAVAVGISVEPAGGSQQPTTQPLAVVPIRAAG
ncbi:anti-sigma factor [Streptomyces sp. NPDC003717]|uniref:anti-sigma factor n=1 Tax=Streptomyces sp. NPDC003717 TaxID=3154276 RepID=UPI0033A79244